MDTPWAKSAFRSSSLDFLCSPNYLSGACDNCGGNIGSTVYSQEKRRQKVHVHSNVFRYKLSNVNCAELELATYS
jgi:hypothetical protein